MSPRSALIVKLGAIGDIVMAAPMATALKRAHPGIWVSWLAGRGVVPLLRLLPDIDEIVEIDEAALLAGNSRDRVKVMARAAGHLRLRKVDLLLNGHPDPRYRVLEQLVRARTVRRFSRNPRERIMPVPGRFHGHEYVRLALGEEGADLPRLLPGPVRLPVPDGLALPEDVPRVALAPGGARNVLNDNEVRRWPLERYAALAQQLDADGVDVLIVGGPGDAWVSEAFADLDRATDLVGRTSLPDLVAVYGRCDAVVTHDSGPMHLARLAHVPVVAMFGPTDPSWFVPPAHPGTTVLRGGDELPCRPCYDGKRFHDCPASVCMHEIPVEDVRAAVADILRAADWR